MLAASSGDTIFVKSFSKLPTFTAHHLWVSFSFAGDECHGFKVALKIASW
jgi:hypothetical protein